MPAILKLYVVFSAPKATFIQVHGPRCDGIYTSTYIDFIGYVPKYCHHSAQKSLDLCAGPIVQNVETTSGGLRLGARDLGLQVAGT